MLDRSFQDVAIYASFRCSGACKTGILLRAEKTAEGTKGVYFALISFGLAQVVSKVVFNTRELGASDGLIGVPAPVWLGLDTAHAPSFFLLVLLGMAALLAFLLWLMNTPFGRQLDAIRTNEHRLPFLGFDPWRYKLAVFVLAAQVAALSAWFEKVMARLCSPFLSPAEIQKILKGSDIWMDSDEIRRRLHKQGKQQKAVPRPGHKRADEDAI